MPAPQMTTFNDEWDIAASSVRPQLAAPGDCSQPYQIDRIAADPWVRSAKGRALGPPAPASPEDSHPPRVTIVSRADELLQVGEALALLEFRARPIVRRRRRVHLRLLAETNRTYRLTTAQWH